VATADAAYLGGERLQRLLIARGNDDTRAEASEFQRRLTADTG
jgi:hypothetical protein